MKKTIVILGVTGTQGGSVARKFQHDPNWTVRGLTRNPSSPAAQALSAGGRGNIELRAFDLDEPGGSASSNWAEIFHGAHAVFAVTDFWAPFTAAYERLSQVSDRAAGEYALDVEVRRAKSVVEAVARERAREGSVLEVFVYSGLPSFSELSGGKYTYAYHYEAKAVVKRYIEEEQPELSRVTSYLNMGLYYSNMVDVPLFAPHNEPDGSFVQRVPCSKDALQSLVYPGDAGKLAALLVKSSPGKNLLAVSELMSYAGFMEIWSDVTGKPSRVVEVSVEELDKAVPGGLGREVGEAMAANGEFGYGKNLLLPWEIDPDVKLTSVREYIEKENWDGILNAV